MGSASSVPRTAAHRPVAEAQFVCGPPALLACPAAGSASCKKTGPVLLGALGGVMVSLGLGAIAVSALVLWLRSRFKLHPSPLPCIPACTLNDYDDSLTCCGGCAKPDQVPGCFPDGRGSGPQASEIHQAASSPFPQSLTPRSLPPQWCEARVRFCLGMIMDTINLKTGGSAAYPPAAAVPRVSVDQYSTAYRFPQCLVVAVRGTLDSADLSADLDVAQVPVAAPPPAGCTSAPAFHRGYWVVANRIASALVQLGAREPVFAAKGPGAAECVLVAGHSLGAASAAILAWLLARAGVARIALFTSASPKIGNASAVNMVCNAVQDRVHVVNLNDVIPQWPLSPVSVREGKTHVRVYYEPFTDRVVEIQVQGVTVAHSHDVRSYFAAFALGCPLAWSDGSCLKKYTDQYTVRDCAPAAIPLDPAEQQPRFTPRLRGVLARSPRSSTLERVANTHLLSQVAAALSGF